MKGFAGCRRDDKEGSAPVATAQTASAVDFGDRISQHRRAESPWALAWIIHQGCRERGLLLAQVALVGGAGGAMIGAGCCG
jgi:hypothetical protein